MRPSSIPLSLYVHWPWCVRKCPYCDFNSHALPQVGDIAERYVNALIADMRTTAAFSQKRPLIGIFFGGGTPSLIEPRLLERFLDETQKIFSFAPDIEITLEANPGTVDTAHFEAYRHMGVNRLSMGIQSFNDEYLTRLGRIHSANDARLAILQAQRYFDNFNLDVMFALPGQTLELLKDDLACALQAQSTHLSFYQLTIEPNTVFAKHVPKELPDIDTQALMQECVINTLVDAGFDHYEVSGYAKPGFHCRHNLNYWQFGDYLACGAGAHSKVTLEDGRILRQARFTNPTSFIEHVEKGNAVAHSRWVDLDDEPFEFMLNVLRLRKGVHFDLLPERTHLTMDDIAPQITEAQKLGLMDKPLTRLCANAKGWNFLSDLQEIFL